VFHEHEPDLVVHFAAESHVDRSIVGPAEFVRTNVQGTFNLLEAARAQHGKKPVLFHHVSTDEVYGSLGPTGKFTETTRYDPSSPYSATKAASDHLVRAYHRTFALPVRISNCSNNYGPYQFPEKLIPLMVLNAMNDRPLPVYGDGSNVRDWLYVDDHCEAIWAVIERGQDGETYNIGGDSETQNLELVHTLCRIVAAKTGRSAEDVLGLVTFVKDRPGHDQRYAMDASKLAATCGWTPRRSLADGLQLTVGWYLDNPEWVARVTSGDYRKWIDDNYFGR
jgi:dTDP-glucose 4,6-dehydratase